MYKVDPEKVAEACYSYSGDRGDPVFHLIWFVENVVLPEDVTGYNKEDFKKYIESFISGGE